MKQYGNTCASVKTACPHIRTACSPDRTQIFRRSGIHLGESGTVIMIDMPGISNKKHIRAFCPPAGIDRAKSVVAEIDAIDRMQGFADMDHPVIGGAEGKDAASA